MLGGIQPLTVQLLRGRLRLAKMYSWSIRLFFGAFIVFSEVIIDVLFRMQLVGLGLGFFSNLEEVKPMSITIITIAIAMI